jgi:hypothetical protein
MLLRYGTAVDLAFSKYRVEGFIGVVCHGSGTQLGDIFGRNTSVYSNYFIFKIVAVY